MCGNVGLVMKGTTGLYKPQEDSFNQLLYIDQLRGEDSTGLIAVENNTTFHVVKEATEATWFLQSYEGSEIQKSMYTRGKAYIGHNRKKTMGAVKDETAHPFWVEDYFAMVHNGTLRNHKKLADTEVDSEALTQLLCKAFDKEDFKEDLEAALAKVEGAYAVAMYDQRYNCVRLLRNKERPLFVVETEKAWYWASEAWMLFGILSRNNELKNGNKIEEVKDDVLYSFDLDKNTLTTMELTIKKSSPRTNLTLVGTGVTNKSFVSHNKNTVGKEMSKSAFKRFRRDVWAKRVAFWATDYVEENFPLRLADGETSVILLGESDWVDVPHSIRAVADLAITKVKEADITDRLWYGRVEDVVYNPKMKEAIIMLGEIRVAPIQTGSQVVLDNKQIEAAIAAGEANENQSTVH